MSKLVKGLLTDHIRQQLQGVEELVVVNVVGMDVNTTVKLRRHLREQNCSLLVIRNSLARRATEGTVLAPAFEGLSGCSAIVWGAEDIVSLTKLVTKIAKDEKTFPKFAARGGVMGGSRMSAEDVEKVSKWPSRAEQLSLLVAQILSPGAKLASQLNSVGGALVSQIKQKAEGEEGAGDAPAEATP
jgi:large subunit ribosomal protein L10